MNSEHCLSTALATCLLTGAASATDLLVPSVQFPTIQSALDAAVGGDRILLAAQTFTQPGDYDLDPHGKSVHILGAGPGATVLAVPAIPNSVEAGGFWITSGGSDLIIEGLTISGAWRTDGAGLHISGAAAPRIVNCVLSTSTAFTRGGGVFISDTAAPSFEGCVFDSVNATLGGAAWIGGTANPSFTNCTFTLCGANWDGGAVYLDAASASFSGCTFSTNMAPSTGGAMTMVAGAQATITDSDVVVNWTTSLAGGALYAVGAGTRLQLVNCTLADNNSAAGGGAVALGDQAELVAADCVFNANLAYSGGALEASGFARATLTRCELLNHQIAGYGGAASIRDHSVAYFDQCSLHSNQAGTSGGGLEVSLGSYARLTSCTLQDNITYGQGGGIYVNDFSSLEFCGPGTFVNNSAANGGGLYASLDSSAVVDGATFDSNHALLFGGAIHLDGWGSVGTETVRFTNSNFIANGAASGGALYANDAASVTVESCVMSTNTAAADGGAAVATGLGASLTVHATTFSTNSAAGFGGAVAIQSDASANFEDCFFADNDAGFDGGAVALSSAATTAHFLRCDAGFNHAGSRGGAFAIDAAQPVGIFESLLHGNMAQVGGAVALSNAANLTLSHSRVELNHALGTGGAGLIESGAFMTSEQGIFLSNDAQLHAGALDFVGGDGALRWCIVDGNVTPGGGGALRASDSAFVRVHGSQMSGNSAASGGAIQALNAARVVLGNATLVGNQATSGGAIAFETPELILANSILWDNVPDSLYTAGGYPAIVNFCDVSGGWLGTGNFNADPQLELLNSQLYIPRAGSPCIDVGDNARVPPLLTKDLLDRPRFLDDPWTPDAGAGTPPIVDLGAIEFRHEPVVYCQGRVNSQGCLPTISTSGVANGWPRACTEGSFLIRCTNAVNNTDGILFFGLAGRVAVPWLGGTLCVRQPVRRTPLVNSAGNPPPEDCSGTFVIDFSAVVCNDPLFQPGTTVNAQWWGRDPSQTGPHKVQISNAIEFVLN